MYEITKRNIRIGIIYTSDSKGMRGLNRFNQRNFSFWASSNATLINSGAAYETLHGYGIDILLFSKGVLMHETNIGGQKFSHDAY